MSWPELKAEQAKDLIVDLLDQIVAPTLFGGLLTGLFANGLFGEDARKVDELAILFCGAKFYSSFRSVGFNANVALFSRGGV